MLHHSAIDAKTLELLKQLQALPELKDLRLVGGTALALQLGHRLSIDLDLFGKITDDEYTIADALSKIGSITQIKKSKNINIYSINGIKVDIVNYPYPWLAADIRTQELRLADIKDIAAMKLAAITGRGSKKDFIDLFYLLRRFSLAEIVDFYHQKFADGSAFLVLKSLTWFEDADTEESPVMLEEVNWNEIKTSLIQEVSKFLANI